MSKMPGDGSIADFESGLIHRDDGEPAQVLKYGTRRRYAFGIHCDTGHAVERLVGRTEYWHRGPPCHAHTTVSINETGKPWRHHAG